LLQKYYIRYRILGDSYINELYVTQELDINPESEFEELTKKFFKRSDDDDIEIINAYRVEETLIQII
jgi:hypothetical protein